MANARRPFRPRVGALALSLLVVLQVLAVLGLQSTPDALADPTVCAVPGLDGPPASPLTGVVNTYYPGMANAPAGATALAVGSPRAGGGPAIGAGDMLLVVQVQDATIDSTNTGAYGDGVAGDPATGATALQSSGFYEYVRAGGPVVAGSAPVIGAGAGGGLLNAYHASPTTANTTQHKFEVVRVPQYSSATLSSGLSASDWDGATGGILAIDVAGGLNLGAGTTVSVTGLGFRGGAARQLTGSATTAADYRDPAPVSLPAGDPQAGSMASKAEGVAGTPRWVFDPVTQKTVDFGVDALPDGSFARGAPGNAGGGGNDGHPVANDQNAGGGGGGNGGTGGKGGNTWSSNLGLGGFGGTAVGASATRVFLGGGGGAGTKNNDDGVVQASAGTSGGGMALLRVGSLSGTGTITANGNAAFNGTLNDGGGGGGAGGTVLVQAPTGTPLAGLTIHADGARGGNAWGTQAPGTTFPGNRHGPGGGGGGGVALTSAAPSLLTAAAGANGVTTTASDPYGATPGTGGVSGTATTMGMEPGSSAGAICLPSLTVTKATSTPTVVQTSSGTSATYTITVSNAAGQGAAIQAAISDALPAGFTYTSTASVGLSGGATRTAVVNPVGGAGNPTWGTFTIPGGGQVQVTFVVAIAASAGLGTYRNPAAVTYADPARSTPGGTLTSSYTPGNGTPDNVTLVAPDLTIAKSHTGNFTRGTSGTYSLVVTNSGNAASSGNVTVSDTLPAGLTPISAAGTGWTCPPPAGQSISCSRSDSLAASAAYPAISVTASVLESAANSVTNTATVAGGGELDNSNDSASNPTTVVSSADLQIVKTHSGNFTVGQAGSYTLTVHNFGPSTAAAPIIVGDTLPSGLTFTGGSGGGFSCSASGQTVTCSTPTPMVSGGTAAVTLNVAVGVGAGTGVTNTATVNSPTTDPIPGNNASSDPTVVAPGDDLGIVKSHSGSFNAGQDGSYTLAVHNAGPSASGGMTVSDNLPAGLTFVSGSGGGFTCSASGQAVTCSDAAGLASGASASISLTVAVGAGAGTGVTNTASVSSPVADSNPANNTSSDPTTVVPQADVGIVKSHPGNFGVVANGTYTLAVSNNGPSSSGALAVGDNLPNGLTFVSGSGGGFTCSATGSAVTCSDPTGLASGGTESITLVVAVGATAAPGMTNVATVSSATADPNPANNSSSDPTVVAPQADLAVTKTVDQPTPNVGQDVTFTVTVRNGGPNDATSVTVGDALPPGLALVSATATAGSYGAGVWTVGTVVNGTTATLTVVATVTQPGLLTNTAAVTHEDQSDPTPSDNTASAGVTGQSADLSIVKSHVGSFTVGQDGTYSLAIHNAGSTPAAGPITVSDPLPAGLAFVSGTGTGWSCSASGSTVTCTNASAMASGADTSITLVVAVSAPAAPQVTNTATVSSSTPDANLANNSSSDPTTVVPQADLALTKSHVGNFTVGQNGTYTLVVTNNGPSAAPVQVSDPLPAGLTFVSGSGGGFICSAAGSAVTCSDPNPLASSGTATITLVVAVGAQAAPAVTNTATVSSPTPDPVSGNNTATDPTTVVPEADLAVSKTVDKANPVVGQNVTFTVTVTNNGPNPATGVNIGDALPAGLTAVSVTPSTGTSYAAPTWTVGNLAASASASLVVVATATRTGPITNTATVTHEDQADPTPADDHASATVNPGPSADVVVAKSASTTTPHLGDNVTFTVTAADNGPSDATGVAVTDAVPAGLVLVSATPSQGGYSAGTWSVGTLVANAPAATLAIVATVAQAGQITNTATKTAEVEFDPNTANDSAAVTLTASPAADLQVAKIVNQPSPHLGENVVFTVSVTNHGPSSATGVVVGDALPAGLTLVSDTPSQGSYSGGSWSVGALANAATATLTVTATVTRLGPITNSAAKSAENEFDPDLNNDSASATVTVQPAADIEVLQSVSPGIAAVGQTVTFTINARDNGPSDAAGVVLSDTLPPGLQLVSASATQGSYSSGAWTVGSLANGATATLTVVATVTQPGTLANTATKSAETEFDPNLANDSASASVNGTAAADIGVTKVVNDASPHVGDNVIYTVTVTDHGPDAATGVAVGDALPAGLTLVSAVASQGTYSAGIWAVGTIANGAGATLTVTAMVTQAGTISNTAAKSAENEVDNTPGNDAATAVLVAQPTADIHVTKTVDTAAPALGQTVTFTVTATNRGPNAATGVAISDALPAGLTLVSATPSQGAYSAGVWTVGTIANQASPTLVIVATVTASGVTTNTATKTAENEFDGTPADDSAQASVTVGAVADIGVTKVASNPAPNVGQAITYTVAATDHGPDAATGVVVTDLLGPGLAFVGATPSQGSYNASTGAWTVGSLANGATATLTVDALVTDAGPLGNTASRTAVDQVDPNPDNDSATVTVDAGTSADLGIAKTHSGDFIAGQAGTYTITVTNHGPSPAVAPTVVDTLPAGLTFVSADNPSAWTCGAAGQVVTCTASGPLVSGGSSGFNLTVAVARAAAPSTTNGATVSSITPDPDRSNNSATDLTRVLVVDLALQKALVGGLNAGQDATYALSVTNVGTAATFGPTTVIDTLPAGLGFVSASGTGWTCAAAGATVTCTTDALLRPGDTSALTLVVLVAASAAGTITNHAVVSTSGDGNVSNNSDTSAASVNVPPPAPALPSAGRPPRTQVISGSSPMAAAAALVLVLMLVGLGLVRGRRCQRDE